MTERKPITLRMPCSLRNRLAEIAKSQGISLNAWIVEQLEKVNAKAQRYTRF